MARLATFDGSEFAGFCIHVFMMTNDGEIKLMSLLVVLVLVVLGSLFIRPLRKATFSKIALLTARKLGLAPAVSSTEMAAIEAGHTGMETEFFQAKIRPKFLSSFADPRLSEEEENFLKGPVEVLCRMCNDWKIWESGDLPPDVWKHLRVQKYFGIIIPRKFGGLEFSRMAHSEIIMKLTSRSIPVGITAMVPNSLGPAELLIKYGTEEQKSFYLPRLADGREIPCFALTEPGAGSDASSLLSEGIVFKDGQELKIRLDWQKRWITLGSVATLMGMAFRLRDPEGLLQTGSEDIGITCALIPAESPGISRECRHDPLGVPFVNSRTIGKNVVIPLSSIIGGRIQAGRGWAMLMECLSAGRGISLPSQCTAGVKSALSVVTAHSSIRYQFGLPIGKFEGVREPIARIAGLSFIIDAARRMTISAMDRDGILPVVSAIAKYNLTELHRIAINDAMDVMGGAGISEGPHNHLAHAYKALPIGITVEGANILTRTLIIFGQGVFRSHPHAFPLMKAIEDNNLENFDRSLADWTKQLFYGLSLSTASYLTRGRVFIPGTPRDIRAAYKRLAWVASTFSLLTNVAMVSHGSALKKKEHLTGRFADVLSWLFLNWAVICHYQNHRGVTNLDKVFKWSLEYGFQRIQEGLEGILRNLGGPFTAWFWRSVPLGFVRLNPISLGPSDQVTENLCDAVESIQVRNFLTAGIYRPEGDDPLARLENAFQAVNDNRRLYAKIRRAGSKGDLPRSDDLLELFDIAKAKGILTPEQHEALGGAERSRRDAIKVDAFWNPDNSISDSASLDSPV